MEESMTINNTEKRVNARRKARNRGWKEIIVDMAKIVRDEGGCIATTMMYSANLSYDQYKKYVEVLIRQGMVDVKPAQGVRGLSNHYYLTAKGMRWLVAQDAADEILGKVEIPQE